LYLKEAHQGKAPTLFKLAFWSADTVGSPIAFIEATNFWMGSLFSHDLCRFGPLSGDVQTKSQKRKGNAFANISAKDLHHHDIVLITSPTTKGFCRCNLHDTNFESMASDHATPSTIDNANLGFRSYPLSRPVTRS
jgi:hypothetical protein